MYINRVLEFFDESSVMICNGNTSLTVASVTLQLVAGMIIEALILYCTCRLVFMTCLYLTVI